MTPNTKVLPVPMAAAAGTGPSGTPGEATGGPPGAPAAPPAFGSSTGPAGRKVRQGAKGGFGSTVLGSAQPPAQIGTKTLLGQ